MDTSLYHDLKDDIKFNCDVSDAQYWGFFSICGLLLRYRDLYRSEQRLKPWANIGRDEIAAWIAAKEARWPELEASPFRRLTIEGKSHDAFDVDAINQALAPGGLVYGAGYGMYMKPTFFLAELKSGRRIGTLTVHTSGPELVRDLLTAPAMLQSDTIFLRLEPLAMLLLYKFNELNAQRNKPLEAAFAGYGFSARQLMDDTFEKRLEGLAERYADIILAHEIAEHREAIPEWKDILASAGDRKNEHYLRALKDLVADTSESGPLKRIIDAKDDAALGLTVSLLDGFHRLLFPELGEAYRTAAAGTRWDAVEQVRSTGYQRFIAERDRIAQLFRESVGTEGFSEKLKQRLRTGMGQLPVK